MRPKVVLLCRQSRRMTLFIARAQRRLSHKARKLGLEPAKKKVKREKKTTKKEVKPGQNLLTPDPDFEPQLHPLFHPQL